MNFNTNNEYVLDSIYISKMINTLIYEYEYEYEYLYSGNIYDMAMKRKFVIYAPGNRNYGYCRLHFGYQIMIYYIHI